MIHVLIKKKLANEKEMFLFQNDLEEGDPEKNHPGVIENPITDEEITRDEAPMLAKAPPSATPNGKDKDNNGWVVPLDQLDNEEPEVEDTKL